MIHDGQNTHLTTCKSAWATESTTNHKWRHVRLHAAALLVGQDKLLRSSQLPSSAPGPHRYSPWRPCLHNQLVPQQDRTSGCWPMGAEEPVSTHTGPEPRSEPCLPITNCNALSRLGCLKELHALRSQQGCESWRDEDSWRTDNIWIKTLMLTCPHFFRLSKWNC